MGGAISGTGAAVSSVIGGIGAKKAGAQQAKYQDEAMARQREGYNNAVNWLSPYQTAGQSALAGLQGLAGQPIDRNQLLSDYFGSQEYQQLANQARYQTLAGAEATGGLGSTATANQLGSIAATLGQNYLTQMTDQQQNMYNQLMGLSTMGLNSANALGNFATGNASALSAMEQQKGQIKAGLAALPYQVAASANSSITNGAAQDVNQFTGMFGGMMGGSF